MSARFAHFQQNWCDFRIQFHRVNQESFSGLKHYRPFRFMSSALFPLATLTPLLVGQVRAQTNTAAAEPPMTLVCSFLHGPPTRRPFPVELFIDLAKHSVKKVYPTENASHVYVNGQPFTEGTLSEVAWVRWQDSSKLSFGAIVKAHPDFTGENDVLDFDTGILQDDAGDVHQCRKAESLR
jgi:hypothetical protein